jgi:hypothetical protein
MSLFGKKAMSLDEILKAINALSDEDKAKLVAEMQGNKAEEEKPVEEVEEVAEATEEETQDEVPEEATEEVTETEETAEPPVEDTPTEEVGSEATEAVAEDGLPEGESARDEMANDNRDEIVHELADKVNALSEQIQSLLELKGLMEEYTQKQADSFGYKGNVLGSKKDYRDMSVEELKARQTKGI